MIRSLVLVAAVAATPASAYITRESYRVDGDAQQFHVEYEPGLSAAQYWCAAGQFVDDYLGLLPTTPVYRLSPKPLERGEGMTFSLSSEGAMKETGVMVFPASDHLSAGFAASLCVPGQAVSTN
ncbi:hypothetical protein [Falsirhodobacter algicola]|uniref:Uncharacterized protein n=1 Tax=Falsirhodobacter algicola TaxID=2692330 RepID=A0A8J8MS92_9RHOB|nr:hypothetical protein [Falsirhodobacter algicola]QUS35479.1 hypothetical protein GR316_03860 [Falsirhodobacter algicola]